MHSPTARLDDSVTTPAAGEPLIVLGEKMTIKSAFPDGSWAVIEVEKNPDSKVPAHSHPWGEIYHIIAGGMRIMLAGQIYDAPAGVCVHIPADVVHQPLGPVQPGTRFLNIVGSVSAVELYRELAREVPPNRFDREKVVSILTRHGVTLA